MRDTSYQRPTLLQLLSATRTRISGNSNNTSRSAVAHPFRQDPLMDAVRCGIDFLGCPLFIPRASGGKREAVECIELIQLFSHRRQNRADGLLVKDNGPRWIHEEDSTLVWRMAPSCPLPQMAWRGFFQHPSSDCRRGHQELSN